MHQTAGPEAILRERYEITQLVNHSEHIAAIFAAYGYDRVSGMEVFMKAKDRDPSDRTQLRLNNEANHLDSLYHPQIPRLVEAKPYAEYPYLVTERMTGSFDPEHWLESNTSHPFAAELCLSALDALQYVHEQGIVHRDIKGPNLVMSWSGRVALVDFELALDSSQRQIRQDPPAGDVPKEARITGAGNFVGTSTHIAPEQLRGAEATERSDIYAIGVSMYRLTYGYLPFKGEMKEVLDRKMTQEINFWPAGRHAPKALRLIMEKATQNDPSDRYESAAAMAEDIERYLYPASALEAFELPVAA